MRFSRVYEGRLAQRSFFGNGAPGGGAAGHRPKGTSAHKKYTQNTHQTADRPNPPADIRVLTGIGGINYP